jgi:GT2 family glycosyltransferase
MSSDAPSPTVGVVVLNWHGRDDTLRCLAAVAALSHPSCQLILVDNGCADFSAAEVAGRVRNALYLRTDVNLGFAGGSNLAMRQALETGADYVWFLNSDAQPEPDALTELLAVATRDPANAVVGPKILQLRDPRRIDSIALRLDLRSGRFSLIGHNEVDHGQYDRFFEVDAVTGCAMLVSRAACERLSGFDEAFFAYLEDADLCVRARAAGYRICVAPRARVLHKREPATRGRQSVSSLYYTTRNHLMLIQRHTAAPQLARLVFAAALNAAYAVRSGKRTPLVRLRAVWRGIRDYRRGVTGAGSQL